MVHGGNETVNAICDHPDISAVAFVGSDAGGRHVHARASAAGKRVQANRGAKNHAVVMPDAPREATLAALAGAAAMIVAVAPICVISGEPIVCTNASASASVANFLKRAFLTPRTISQHSFHVCTTPVARPTATA